VEEENPNRSQAGVPETRDADCTPEIVCGFMREMEMTDDAAVGDIVLCEVDWEFARCPATQAAQFPVRFEWNGGGTHSQTPDQPSFSSGWRWSRLKIADARIQGTNPR